MNQGSDSSVAPSAEKEAKESASMSSAKSEEEALGAGGSEPMLERRERGPAEGAAGEGAIAEKSCGRGAAPSCLPRSSERLRAWEVLASSTSSARKVPTSSASSERKGLTSLERFE